MLGFLPTRAYRPGTPGATTFLSPLSGTFNYGWDSFGALDTSAPGLDSPPTPTTLAAPLPLWAQIGFRPFRLPSGAPRQPELVRHAFPRLHARRVIRVCSLHQEVQPFPARPGPVLWRMLTPPCPSNAIADAVVRINRTGPEASQGKPRLFPAIPAEFTPPRVRVAFGLYRILPAHPVVMGLLSDSCSSGPRFASGSLQLPPHDGHPCPRLSGSALPRSVRDSHSRPRACLAIGIGEDRRSRSFPSHTTRHAGPHLAVR